jgi:hypothetical protein
VDNAAATAATVDATHPTQPLTNRMSSRNQESIGQREIQNPESIFRFRFSQKPMAGPSISAKGSRIVPSTILISCCLGIAVSEW